MERLTGKSRPAIAELPAPALTVHWVTVDTHRVAPRRAAAGQAVKVGGALPAYPPTPTANLLRLLLRTLLLRDISTSQLLEHPGRTERMARGAAG